MQKILFTRGNNPASWIICKVTGEPVSHCAVQWNQWVIQANFLGVHIELLSTFQKSSQIIDSIEVPEDSTRLMDSLAQSEGAWYDFLGMFYLGLKCILPWLPKKNLWHTSGMFMCTGWVTDVLGDEDDMITPYQLYTKLITQKRSN